MMKSLNQVVFTQKDSKQKKIIKKGKKNKFFM
jgi:hypothetical protein